MQLKWEILKTFKREDGKHFLLKSKVRTAAYFYQNLYKTEDNGATSFYSERIIKPLPSEFYTWLKLFSKVK